MSNKLSLQPIRNQHQPDLQQNRRFWWWTGLSASTAEAPSTRTRARRRPRGTWNPKKLETDRIESNPNPQPDPARSRPKSDAAPELLVEIEVLAVDVLVEDQDDCGEEREYDGECTENQGAPLRENRRGSPLSFCPNWGGPAPLEAEGGAVALQAYSKIGWIRQQGRWREEISVGDGGHVHVGRGRRWRSMAIISLWTIIFSILITEHRLFSII